MKQKVITIIPAYNEESMIRSTTKKVMKYADLTIIVDDGSEDNTYEEAKKSGAIVLKHIVNMGKGVAMKTGIEYAIKEKGDIIILIDGDGQHNPAEIPRLLKLLEQNKTDVILGTRQMPKNSPIILKLGNWGLNQIFRILFKAKIEDTQNGFRVLRTKIYPKIKWKTPRYFVETEMVINIVRNKVNFVETPIQTFYHDVHKGTTVLNGLHYFIKMVEAKIYD